MNTIDQSLGIAPDQKISLSPRDPGSNSRMAAEFVATSELKLDEASPRRFAQRDIRAAKAIITRFGVRVPIVVAPDSVVLVGQLTLLAAQELGIDALPVIAVDDLGAVELEALSVAYGKLGELGSWDLQQLGTLMLKFEVEIAGFDVLDLGFEVGEVDVAIAAAGEFDDGSDNLPEAGPPVSKVGDLFLLGKHRLLCGDARDPAVQARVMDGKVAHMVFADPPFGCKIDGFVAGKGRHREFVMGSGEMSDEELSKFFTDFVSAMLPNLARGALVYLVIDWRSLHLLLDATRPLLGKLLNLAVWVKDRAGMGSFLRSQHELILIFKTPGKARNNVELGRHGRDRSNVFQYKSAATFGKGSDEGDMLAQHPTPKPVALIADAILDCTMRGEIVLDMFLGSGSSLISAEKVGRVCYGLELDPLYVDLIVRRWQAWSGDHAMHADSGRRFDDLAHDRADVASAAAA